jgi:transposase InsO family protein
LKRISSYNNPKGNADTERIMCTLKEECLWLKEWRSPFHLAQELEHWIEVQSNQNYLHSSLAYKTPCQVEAQFNNSHITQLNTLD